MAQTGTPRAASIVGTVSTDAGEPVNGAVVELLGTSLAARTGEDGSFRLDRLGGGTMVMMVRRLGFAPLEVEVDLLPGEDFAIAPGVLVMSPVAVGLSGLAVRGERLRWAPRLERSGFYGRMERELGVFANREQLDSWNPRVFTDVLRHMTGVRVRPNPRYGQRPNGLAPRDTRRYLVELTRNPMEGCPPLLFIDGVYMGNLGGSTSTFTSTRRRSRVSSSIGDPRRCRRASACAVPRVASSWCGRNNDRSVPRSNAKREQWEPLRPRRGYEHY